MVDPSISSLHLRVKALQPRRRRAGLEFTSAPADLSVEMLGTGLAAIVALAAILADPQLSVTVVEGETERGITPEERDALTAFLEAEEARVDPSDPPTPDAGANRSAASGDAAADPAPAAEATKLQDPDGAEDKPEGAAASDGASEAKVAEVKDAAAVDPARADGAAAAQSEQSRETADAAASDRKAAAEEGSQPEAASRPPVAAPNSARRPGRNSKA